MKTICLLFATAFCFSTGILAQQDSLRKYDNYFSIGITDGNVADGLGSFLSYPPLYEDFGPGVDVFVPRRVVRLTIDYSRKINKHTITMSYFTVPKPRVASLRLSYGYEILQYGKSHITLAAGLMYGNIADVNYAAFAGLRSHTYLWRNIHWYNNLGGYVKPSNWHINVGRVYYTTGLSYKF